MANATPQAARRGFELFKNGWPLDTLNHELEIEGHTPVSMRMFKHYRSLRRHGYDQYVPVNELDVSVKARRAS